jgi:signal transduction histidine kinase
MGNVDDPARWHGDRGPHRHWHRGPSRMRRGPLRRDPADRIAGGVAAGVAAWRGFSVTAVRIVFVLIALVSTGIGVALYVAAWLLIPAAGADSNIASKARSDSRGIRLAIGLASLLALVLLAVSAFNRSWFVNAAWPQVVSVAGLVLIWRNAPADEQATLRHLVEPLETAAGSPRGEGGSGGGRRWALRVVIAGALLIAGVASLFSAHASLALLRPLGGVLLVIAGVVLLLGPWWLRIARDLVLERQAKIRAEERADISARIHDSVLQTLALIQRRADDPQKVVQLARLQERELRSWLFEGRAPNETEADLTLADGVRQIQQDVEARYGVPVEAVTVGDGQLDDNLNALLAAAREATVNAAKWSGASVISLFAEVEPEEVSIVVRDRGQGFDPDAVPDDRKGLAESVHGRMARRGGTATVITAKGEGTKVTLKMPRTGTQPRPAQRPGGPQGGPDGWGPPAEGGSGKPSRPRGARGDGSPPARGALGGSSPPRGVRGDGSPRSRGGLGGSSPRDDTASRS